MWYLVKRKGRTLSKHKKMSLAKKSMKSKPNSYIVKRKFLYPRDK